MKRLLELEEPRASYFLRCLPVLLALGCLFFGGLGLFLSESRDQSLWSGALDVYGSYARRLSYPPIICEGRENLNPFQQKQCAELQTRNFDEGLVLVLPFLGLLLLWMFLKRWLAQVYATARKVIDKAQKPVDIAKVVEPSASNKPDFYLWWFGFRLLHLEDDKGRHFTAAYPSDASVPQVGTRVSIFEWKPPLYQTIYLAQPFTPHVAVLSGSSKS